MLTGEQRLCAFYLVLWVGTFADCFFRGCNSVFGRVFIWLATL